MQRKVCARKIDELGRIVLPQDTVPLVTKAALKFLFKENLKYSGNNYCKIRNYMFQYAYSGQEPHL